MSPIPSVKDVLHRERYVPKEDDMRIMMDQSTKGSRDGTVTEMFLKGQEYDVPSSLGLVFVEEIGVAHLVEVKAAEPEEAPGAGPSETQETGPGENKDAGEELVWTKKTSPEKYLERWPDSDASGLAKAFLEQEAKKAEAEA